MYRDPLEPRTERRRNWSGAATAIVVVAVAAAGVGLWSWMAAEDARDQAFITPPATIDNPAPIPQAGRDLAGEREAFNQPALVPAPAVAPPARGGIENAVATPGGDMAIAPAGFDRGVAAAPLPDPAAQPPTPRPDAGGAAAGNVAQAPAGRDFQFQPLPQTPAAGAAIVAQGQVQQGIPPLRGDAAAADAMIGAPEGQRAAPPAEIAVQADIGKTPETQRLENVGDVTAAIVGGQEATVKGKVARFDDQARTITLDNGNTYVLADNLRVGEGQLRPDILVVGNDVQVVYRTDADRRVVISVTDLPDQTLAPAAPAGIAPAPAAN